MSQTIRVRLLRDNRNMIVNDFSEDECSLISEKFFFDSLQNIEQKAREYLDAYVKKKENKVPNSVKQDEDYEPDFNVYKYKKSKRVTLVALTSTSFSSETHICDIQVIEPKGTVTEYFMKKIE